VPTFNSAPTHFNPCPVTSYPCEQHRYNTKSRTRPIAEYRDAQNPNLRLTLATHGNGEKTQRRLTELVAAFPFLQFLNSHKTSPVHPDFVAPCVAPVDIDHQWAKNHRYEGCSVSGHCGISFNYAGFYPCAVAGAIDRIFGLDQAIRNLADVSEAAMIEKYQVFCRLCGYYRPIRESSQTILSPTWRAALERYRARQAASEAGTPIPQVLI
jgi:hypothetical protein